MEAIRMRAKALFSYAEDGIHAVPLVPGQVFNARANLVPGLLEQELAEEADGELTTPEEAAELHAVYADPHVEAGVTPWQGARVGEQEPALLTEEHLEPIRRRVRERVASGKGVAAMAEERPAEPEVPDADDQEIGKTRDEVLAGPGRKASAADKAKGGPDYATKDEKAVGRKRDRSV